MLFLKGRIGLIFCVIFTFCLASFLTACGGQQATENNVPIQSVAKYQSFLYGNVNSTTEYIDNWNSISDEDAYPKSVFDTSGIDTSGYKKSLVKITYTSNNLPQYAVHLHRILNTKLLIYNHGHAGLPASNEQYARDFIRKALDADFDVLITSLPLSGINMPDPQHAGLYKMKVYGRDGLVAIGDDLLALQPHLLYELIDDKDHYMHYFIDPIVIFASITKKQSSAITASSNYTKTVVSAPSQRYETVDFVGLSGGGNAGLSACGLLSFDKCILIAGFFPEYLRVSSWFGFGDAEQSSRSLYSEFPYERLIDNAESVTKKVVYVYNRFDNCCFRDPEATMFSVDFPNLDIRLTDLTFHGYSAAGLIEEISN